MHPWYFYIPHNLPKRKGSSHLLPTQISGSGLACFPTHASCLFHIYWLYSAEFMSYDFHGTLFMQLHHKSPLAPCCYILHLYLHLTMSDHSGIFSGYAITNITVSEIIIQCCCLGVSMYLCLGSRQANTKYALLSLILFMGAAGLCTFPQDFY